MPCHIAFLLFISYGPCLVNKKNFELLLRLWLFKLCGPIELPCDTSPGSIIQLYCAAKGCVHNRPFGQSSDMTTRPTTPPRDRIITR